MKDKSCANRIEEKLGLHLGFFENLLKEDDWSFVIKLHAFIDAACTNLLLYHFQEPNISEPLSLLELGNPRTGKVIFLKKLGLITSEHSKQIRELGKLRNEFAHKISDASKTIEDKFRDFDKQQRKNFLGAFPVESALIARLMKEFTNYKSLPAIDPESLISALKNKEKHYDFKLQIWSSISAFLVHLEEIEGFSDFRQFEKIKALE